jgi:hypothetical protein
VIEGLTTEMFQQNSFYKHPHDKNSSIL